MLKKIGVLLTLIVFLCAGTALAAPKKGGTLIFGRGGDSVGLDPAYETDGNSFMICDNLFEALVAYKDESTALEPGLAESWTISSDGKTYTFKLRKGVKFHDGTPFNAEAVKFSFNRLHHIGKTCIGAWESISDLNSIEVLDEYTVKLTFTQANPTLIYYMTNFGSPMFSPKSFDKEGTFITAAAGTGLRLG